jgi:hypothetical protein
MNITIKCLLAKNWLRFNLVNNGYHSVNPIITPYTAPRLRTKWKCPTTKYVSCKRRSNELLLNVIPVSPPKVNRNRNPVVHKRLLVIETFEDHRVANHEKTLIPVGIAIIIVALVK